MPFGSLTEGTSYAVARRNNQLDTFRRPATSNIRNVVLCVCVGRVSLINFILLYEHFNCVLVVISITTWASPHTATVQQPHKGEHYREPAASIILKVRQRIFTLILQSLMLLQTKVRCNPYARVMNSLEQDSLALPFNTTCTLDKLIAVLRALCVVPLTTTYKDRRVPLSQLINAVVHHRCNL